MQIETQANNNTPIPTQYSNVLSVQTYKPKVKEKPRGEKKGKTKNNGNGGNNVNNNYTG